MRFLEEPVRLDIAINDPRAYRLHQDGTGVLYRIVNIETAMAYIGINLTISFRSRIQSHCRKNSGCFKIRNALRAHGLQHFTVQILAWDVPKKELLKMEYDEIINQKTLDPDGYNLRHGGTSSPMNSEEIRKKQRATKNTPEGKARASAASKEFSNRPEVKRKRSIAIIAKHKTNKELRSNSAKIAMNRPDVKARHKAACNTEESLLKRAAATRKSHADPESKARRSIALKEAWVRRKAMYGGTGFRKQPLTL